MYQRILVPLKLGEGDQTILKHALDLARLTGAIIFLMHAVHGHTRDSLSYLEEEARSYLEDRAAEVRREGVEAKILIVAAAAQEGIRAARQEVGAHLVVMGSHGHSQVRHILLGSVTEAVIRACHVPVLLVRPGGNPERDE